MLLNAQGCSHAVPKHARGRRSGSGSGGGSLPFLSPRRANGSNEDSDGRQPPSPTDGPGGRVAVEREAGASGKPADAEETLASVSAGNGNEQEENASIASVELCRCRRVVRVLARLVRGLPREAPAVVVKRGGIRSIVQILEDAARVAAAEAEAGAESAGEEEALEDEKGGDKSARTHAAAAEVLEVRISRGGCVVDTYVNDSATWRCLVEICSRLVCFVLRFSCCAYGSHFAMMFAAGFLARLPWFFLEIFLSELQLVICLCYGGSVGLLVVGIVSKSVRQVLSYKPPSLPPPPKKQQIIKKTHAYTLSRTPMVAVVRGAIGAVSASQSSGERSRAAASRKLLRGVHY